MAARVDRHPHLREILAHLVSEDNPTCSFELFKYFFALTANSGLVTVVVDH